MIALVVRNAGLERAYQSESLHTVLQSLSILYFRACSSASEMKVRHDFTFPAMLGSVTAMTCSADFWAVVPGAALESSICQRMSLAAASCPARSIPHNARH